MKNNCSTGFDTIPVKYLKPASKYIASPITNIINNCVKTNNFPSMWKIARISPIKKVKVPTKPSDYRPISVLTVLSKVFERNITSSETVYRQAWDISINTIRLLKRRFTYYIVAQIKRWYSMCSW